MNKIFKKLRSRAGESLVESLAAILVVTMASIVMYSMVTAAADINLAAKRNDQAVQEQMAIAERAETPDDTGIINMYIKAEGSNKNVASVTVNIYGEDGGLFSYFAPEVPGT